jgi:hypothetical protein
MNSILNTVIILFSFYGLTHALKEGSIFDNTRIYLIGKHKLFFDLFSCYACVGFWVGLFIYLVANPISDWSIWMMFIWGCGSSGISFVMNVIVDRLNR